MQLNEGLWIRSTRSSVFSAWFLQWNILLHVVLRHFIISIMMKLSFNYSICMQSPVVYGGHRDHMYATWYTFTKNSSGKINLSASTCVQMVDRIPYRSIRLGSKDKCFIVVLLLFIYSNVYPFSLWLYGCTTHDPFSWLFVLNYFSFENRNK